MNKVKIISGAQLIVELPILENGKSVFAPVKNIFSVTPDGTQVVLSDKELAYVRRANTQYLRSQQILKAAYEGAK